MDNLNLTLEQFKQIISDEDFARKLQVIKYIYFLIFKAN